MGLEPTTFCMANGSWVHPIRASTPHHYAKHAGRESNTATRPIRSVSVGSGHVWAAVRRFCPFA